MDTPKEFEILIRREMPFLSSFLYGLMIFLFAFLFILYLVMFPALHSKSSAEMQTAYYILVVPNALKTLSSYSFIGLLIVVPLYYKARLHKPAKLRVHKDRISILGKQVDIDIAARKIDKIFCNDLHNAFQKPKGILQFVIKQKHHKSTTLRLKHYDQGEEVLSALSNLEKVEFAFYEDNMISDHQDE